MICVTAAKSGEIYRLKTCNA